MTYNILKFTKDIELMKLLIQDKKINMINNLIPLAKNIEEIHNLLDKLSSVIEDQATEIENKSYYDLLKKRSIKLQNRSRESLALRTLVFKHSRQKQNGLMEPYPI